MCYDDYSQAGCLKSIFSPNSDSSSTKGTFLVGTSSALSLCFRFLDFFSLFSVGLTFGAGLLVLLESYPLMYSVGVGHSGV